MYNCEKCLLDLVHVCTIITEVYYSILILIKWISLLHFGHVCVDVRCHLEYLQYLVHVCTEATKVFISSVISTMYSVCLHARCRIIFCQIVSTIYGA